MSKTAETLHETPAVRIVGSCPGEADLSDRKHVDHPFIGRDLTTATFLLCHQRLPCFVIKNFPAFSSTTFPLVMLSAVRGQPNGAEGPHACVQRLRPIQEFPPPLPQRFEPAKVLNRALL